MQPASMPTRSADSKASGLANHQGTAGKQSEARALVSQLLNLHVVWTGFPPCARNGGGECLTVARLMCTGPARR